MTNEAVLAQVCPLLRDRKGKAINDVQELLTKEYCESFHAVKVIELLQFLRFISRQKNFPNVDSF
jgi:hypothetical protein